MLLGQIKNSDSQAVLSGLIVRTHNFVSNPLFAMQDSNLADCVALATSRNISIPK